MLNLPVSIGFYNNNNTINSEILKIKPKFLKFPSERCEIPNSGEPQTASSGFKLSGP
jgi:hypothetical protein